MLNNIYNIQFPILRTWLQLETCLEVTGYNLDNFWERAISRAELVTVAKEIIRQKKLK